MPGSGMRQERHSESTLTVPMEMSDVETEAVMVSNLKMYNETGGLVNSAVRH